MNKPSTQSAVPSQSGCGIKSGVAFFCRTTSGDEIRDEAAAETAAASARCVRSDVARRDAVGCCRMNIIFKNQSNQKSAFRRANDSSSRAARKFAGSQAVAKKARVVFTEKKWAAALATRARLTQPLPDIHFSARAATQLFPRTTAAHFRAKRRLGKSPAARARSRRAARKPAQKLARSPNH